jgi:F-type H+-transporting ATPase subunit epsilon
LVTVLADTAARAKDLDEAQALAARHAAEDALRNSTDKVQVAEAQAQMARVAAQLRLIQKLRKKA